MACKAESVKAKILSPTPVRICIANNHGYFILYLRLYYICSNIQRYMTFEILTFIEDNIQKPTFIH
ncbi:MAG: hypothetical protein ACFFDT_04890 [Candidatus Hodarchaeota archaeon]